MDVTCSSTSHSLWVEVFPQFAAVYENPFSVGPGDEVTISASWSGSTAYFYMQNEYGTGQGYSASFANGTGSTAEWVVEKSTTPTAYPLARWTTGGQPDIYFSNCAGQLASGDWVTAGAPPHESEWEHSLLSGGAEVASGGAWTDAYYADFPIKRYANQDQ